MDSPFSLWVGNPRGSGSGGGDDGGEDKEMNGIRGFFVCWGLLMFRHFF